MLQLDAEMADLVGGLDEGAADIVVADDAQLEGDARLLRIADRRRHAGVGHRDDDVGGDVALARELGADALAHLVDAGAVDHGVGPREVDVLEDAGAPTRPRERLQGTHAPLLENHHLPGLDVAHELRADDVERAGLRGQDVRLAEPAEDERAHAQRIAHADDRRVGEADERVGALHLAQRIDQAVDHAGASGGRDEMDDDLGVGRRLEQGAALHQSATQPAGVRQVAVVGEREAAELQVGEQRLDVAQHGLAGGGVAVVADRRVALEPLHHRLAREDVAHLAQIAVGVELPAVVGDDAGGLLAAVLQRVQAQRGVGGRVRAPVDAEDAALLARLVAGEGMAGDGHSPPLPDPEDCVLSISRSRSLRSASL